MLSSLDIASAANTLASTPRLATHDPPTPLTVYRRPHDEPFCALAPTQAGSACCMLVAATRAHVLVIDARSPHNPQLVWQHALHKQSASSSCRLQLQATWTMEARVPDASTPAGTPAGTPAANADRQFVQGGAGSLAAPTEEAAASQPALQGANAWAAPTPAPHARTTHVVVHVGDWVGGTVATMRAWFQPASHRLASGDSGGWLQVLPLGSPRPALPRWAWQPHSMRRWGVVAGVAAGLPLCSVVDDEAGHRLSLGPAALRWCRSALYDMQVR